MTSFTNDVNQDLTFANVGRKSSCSSDLLMVVSRYCHNNLGPSKVRNFRDDSQTASPHYTGQASLVVVCHFSVCHQTSSSSTPSTWMLETFGAVMPVMINLHNNVLITSFHFNGVDWTAKKKKKEIMKKNCADMQFACWCCEMGVFFYCIELVLKNKIPPKRF